MGDAHDYVRNQEFTVKDSGKRQEFSSGMVRDVTEGKTDFALILDGPMFVRWAVHLTKGALKYAKRNWMLAQGEEELNRFKESAFRHFLQWYNGDTDEDHAAAVFFNINGAEFVKGLQPPAVPKQAAAEVFGIDTRPPDTDDTYERPGARTLRLARTV